MIRRLIQEFMVIEFYMLVEPWNLRACGDCGAVVERSRVEDHRSWHHELEQVSDAAFEVDRSFE